MTGSKRLEASITSLGRMIASKPVVAIGVAGLVAQTCNALVMPLLSRLYHPLDFGKFSVYIAFLALAAVFSSFRYEVAIPIPADRDDGRRLLRLAFWFNAAWAVLLYAIGAAFPGILLAPLDALRPIWGLTCLGVASLGVYQALTAWAMRERAYGTLARYRLDQGLVQPVAKAGMGWLGSGSGLILGDILGRVWANLLLTFRMRRDLFGSLEGKGTCGWKPLLVRYRGFPLVAGWAGLLNAAGLYLPILMFAKLYSPTQTGLFGLAQTMVAIPMILLGQALTQVYTGELGRLVREEPAGLHAYLKRAVRRLAMTGILPILALGLLGPMVFGFIFGREWARAGDYVRLLVPMFLFQFLASPVSNTLNLLEAQGTQLAWDALRVALLLIWFMAAKFRGWPDRTALLVFSGLMAILYGLHLLLILRQARLRSKCDLPY